MNRHFIFEEGFWLGKGEIEFSMLPGKLNFYMRWRLRRDKDKIESIQEIEIEGGAESLENKIIFSAPQSGCFRVSLENAVMQRLEGSGVIEEDSVAWEFKGNEELLEGFEVYRRQDEGYIMKAEYVSPDQVKTTICGKIWRQQEEKDDY